MRGRGQQILIGGTKQFFKKLLVFEQQHRKFVIPYIQVPLGTCTTPLATCRGLRLQTSVTITPGIPLALLNDEPL